jgi:hypothetical protein
LPISEKEIHFLTFSKVNKKENECAKLFLRKLKMVKITHRLKDEVDLRPF